jgi:hypothetical protein
MEIERVRLTKPVSDAPDVVDLTERKTVDRKLAFLRGGLPSKISIATELSRKVTATKPSRLSLRRILEYSKAKTEIVNDSVSITELSFERTARTAAPKDKSKLAKS